MWQSDICWCMDSERCLNTSCFRHLTHKSDEEKIFTCGKLMYTEYCPGHIEDVRMRTREDDIRDGYIYGQEDVMSAYIQFFVRNENAFMPIGIYSRNNTVYQYFDEYTPWEKIKPVTRGLLNKVRDDINEDLAEVQKRYDRAKEMKEWIATLNNSLEEKMEYIENTEEVLSECREAIEQLTYTKHYLNFLDDVIESVEYEEYIDHNNYLYVGIEVGNPTVDDIVR